MSGSYPVLSLITSSTSLTILPAERPEPEEAAGAAEAAEAEEAAGAEEAAEAEEAAAEGDGRAAQDAAVPAAATVTAEPDAAEMAAL